MLLGHAIVCSSWLSSCQGAILAAVVMGDAPEVLVITHTTEQRGSGHPCSKILQT